MHRLEFDIPRVHYINEDKREEIRDWILAKSMDPKIINVLDTTPCENCGTETYVGNRKCHQCLVSIHLTNLFLKKVSFQTPRDLCIVSGMPVASDSKLTDKEDPHFLADKDVWLKWKANVGICPVRNKPL